MSIKDIFCQARAINSLQRAFAVGRLAHAYIFAGPDGVGKFTTAREWAKVLLCNDRTEEQTDIGRFFDSCGKCDSCTAFDNATHPDYNHIRKELVQFTKKGKGKKPPVDMPIDVIREFLIDRAPVRPMMSEFTVFIIRQAERLNPNSQNALLKVLEEPPAHCFIILLSCQPEKLLPTTRSRCQLLRFGPIDHDRIVTVLTDMGIDKTQAAYWAGFSAGSMGTAIEWAQLQPKDQTCYDIKKRLITDLANLELPEAIAFADRLVKSAKGITAAWSAQEPATSKTDITRRVQKGLLQMIIAAFSDVIKLHIAAKAILVNADQVPEVKILAKRFTAEQAAEKIAKTSENAQWVDRSVNEKLIFEELLLNYAGCGIMNC